MENERIIDKTGYELELLKNKALINYCDLVFDYSDFENENGVCRLKFCALENSRCKVRSEFTVAGAATVRFNGVIYPTAISNGANDLSMEFFAVKGENVLELDFSNANSYAVGKTGVSGYVKRIKTDSKIICCAFGDDYFLCTFDALKKQAKVTLFTSGGGYFDLISANFDDFTLAKISESEVVAAGLEGGYMDCFILSATLRDLIDSTSIACDALKLSGVFGGVVAIDDKNSLKKYAFSGTSVTPLSTDIKCKRVVSAPDANDVILIGIDDKARLCRINFPQ